MSRFRDIRLGFSKTKLRTQSTLVSAVHRENSSPAANDRNALQNALEEMYWEGARDELENIIRTLAIWQQPTFADVSVPDEDDDFVHGFDTFVDQRGLAKMDWTPDQPSTYLSSLKDAAMDRKAEYISSKIKSSVRKTLEAMPTFTRREKRVWMLLQAAGFLDIEKLIDGGPAAKKEKRPVVPQLDFSRDRPLDFYPMHCANTQCNAIITGSMFVSEDPKEPRVVCEGCYLRFFYGKESYIKRYKHCVLSEAITPEESRKICSCQQVAHFDEDNNPLPLFPVDSSAPHVAVRGTCQLCKLDDIVGIAKYNALRKATGVKETKKERKLNSAMHAIIMLETPRPPEKSVLSKFRQSSKFGHDRLDHLTPGSTTSTTVVTNPQADPDVPMFFKEYIDENPFANVHVRLRIGPLIIANGVLHTEDGAIVTLREAPVYHRRLSLSDKGKRSLMVTGSKEQKQWQHIHLGPRLTNYRAVLKQVVGAPFSGLLPQDDERALVCEILDASKSLSGQGTDLKEVLERLLELLMTMIGSRVKIYLSSIAERLWCPTTRLAWNSTHNNCQQFCDSLIDHNIFGGLTSNLAEPLYLMSFVCPDEGYLRPIVQNKFSVPAGLTQDYISQFYFGHSDKDADIIDTYQEYWSDWGAFGGPIYKYQNIFPWDCTEAYGRYPTCCGNCNMSKHVWAFPFDSWSMISHHLTREQHMYAPSSLSEPQITTEPSPQAWMRNRLNVLSASTKLYRAAAAMAKTAAFRSATAWLSSSSKPGSELRSLYPSLVRVKLGGIHRAQPFSHLLFDAKKHTTFFLADWAKRPPNQQVAAYEAAREERIRLADVPKPGAPPPPPLKAGGGSGFSSQLRGRSQNPIDLNESYTDAAFSSRTAASWSAGCAVSCGTSCGTGCGNSSCGGAAGSSTYPATSSTTYGSSSNDTQWPSNVDETRPPLTQGLLCTMSLLVTSTTHKLHQAAEAEIRKLKSWQSSEPLDDCWKLLDVGDTNDIDGQRPLIPAPSLFKSLTITTTTKARMGEDGYFLPTPAQCAAHLELLEVFFALRYNIVNSAALDTTFGVEHIYKKTKIRDNTFQDRRREKWEFYLKIAVQRFDTWIRAADKIVAEQVKEEKGVSLPYLPPLDVLMFWHACLLNPVDFENFCRDHELRIIRHVEFPWAEIHEAINTRTWTYELPKASREWTKYECQIEPDLFHYLVEIGATPTSPVAQTLSRFGEPKGQQAGSLWTTLKQIVLGERDNQFIKNLVQIQMDIQLPARVSMVENVKRQASFVDKMHSHLWIRSPAVGGTLRRAIDRYSKFLKLFQLYPDKMLVPTLDIDLVWHTHQCSAVLYEEYMRATTGRYINHDDKIDKKALGHGADETQHLFRTRFGHEYSVCLCWDCEMLTTALEKVDEKDETGLLDDLDMADFTEKVGQYVSYYRSEELRRRADLRIDI
ncbi:hypothetical protein UA08_07335 [Talaromyces atroroseus]|uniref:Uncharacterized protein n=1 Tax=Talaromyces atroroseus TaxID=1441469 RepID=A0A225AUP1_TALAT|nr:hypothetical protein UA08_07335 [Talaromyces atroroseus]OKL57187.1 hypothetical protein UA08_07335 [Talaromyces atroroseus]